MSAILKDVRIGDCRLILGDCLEVMPLLGEFDAVVTDPPYGIGYDKQAAAGSGKKSGNGFANKSIYILKDWDSVAPQSAVDLAISIAENSIIFGGNYFDLPPSKCWLVWDKEINGNFADCELCWTNIDKPARLIRHMWNGGIRKGQEARNGHPTQKPFDVMKWCLGHVGKAETILDPFMGSGTTLVACAKLGRKGTGIELDPEYFEIACKRVEEAYRQGDMFTPAPEKPIAPVQIDLLGEDAA